MVSPPPQTASLTLRTLGAAFLCSDETGETLLGAGKPLALLTYLALTPGHRTSREFLIDLLWADLDPNRARSALRQALFHLRRLLGDEALPGTEELTLARHLDSDRDRFLAAVEGGDLERAVETYGGEFLPSFGVPGGAAFEHWADLERDRLRTAFLRTTELVVRRLLNQSRFREAQRLARRARDEAPHAEAAWRLVLDATVAGRDFVAAAVEADAFEQRAQADGMTIEPATRASIARARQLTPNGDTDSADRSLVADLTGREREFSAITAAWETARTGLAGHLHLKAPAGFGKTRLLHDAVARLRSGGVTVAELRGAPGDRDIPYAFAGDLAAAIAALPGATGIAPGSAGALVALNPALSATFSAVADPASGEDALRRRVQAITELIHAVAHERPFVLAIDDLHWIDPSSWRLLEGVMGRLGTAQVLCLTAARPERVPSNPGMVSLPLGALSAAEIGNLVAALGSLPPEPWAEGFVTRLHQATGGSPLLVLETLRLALDDGALQLDDGRWQSGDATRLAALLRAGEAVRQRILAAPEAGRWLLALLATAGTPLPADALASMTEQPVPAVADALADLERIGLVGRTGHEFTTTHDEIARAAREVLDPESARRAELAVGRHLAVTAGLDAHRLLRGARHLASGGEDATLAVLFRRFARLARERRDRRPFGDLAAEFLGEDAGSPRAAAMAGRLPLPWRFGLWNTARQLAALGLTVGFLAGVVVLRLRSAAAPAWPRLVYLTGAEVSAVTANPADFTGQNEPVTPRPATSALADAARSFPELPPTRSPDGASVAWVRSLPDSTTLDIWLRTSRGTRRLTSEVRDDLAREWLPDGSGLLGLTGRWAPRGRGSYDVAVFDTASGAARPVTRSPEHEGAPSLSPDGVRVAFTREQPAGGSVLCVTAFDGLDPAECRLPGGNPIAELAGWIGPTELLLTVDSASTRRLVRYDWDRREMVIVTGPRVQFIQLSPDRQWAVAAIQIEGITGTRDWVIPLAQPTGARRIDDAPGSIRWWEGAPDRSGLIDRIELADSTRTLPLEVVTQERIRAVTADGTVVPVRAPVRWHSADTTVATVDSAGIVHPRRAGTVTLSASLAGWRSTRAVFRIEGTPERTIVEERWDEGWDRRWIVFGDPRPEVVSGPGGVRAFWNHGDGVFISLAILRRSIPVQQGAGVDIRVSAPATSRDGQRLRIVLAADLDTAAFRAADPRGPPPQGRRMDAACGVGYPGTGGGYQGPSAVTGVGQAIDVMGGVGASAPLDPATEPARRAGAWWTIRLQILPDGRCGVAVNGRPVWLSAQPLPRDVAYWLRLGDESVGTRLLHGPVTVWTGVRGGVDWSAAPGPPPR